MLRIIKEILSSDDKIQDINEQNTSAGDSFITKWLNENSVATKCAQRETRSRTQVHTYSIAIDITIP